MIQKFASRRAVFSSLMLVFAAASLAALHEADFFAALSGESIDQTEHRAGAKTALRPTAAHLAATVAGIAPTYGLQVSWTSPLNAIALATGDFDGNGRDDLAAVVPNVGVPGVSVNLFQQGLNGVLLAPVVLPLPDAFGGTTTFSLVAADLNEDGRSDLVLNNYQLPGLHYLLSNAQGGFDLRTDDWANLVSRVPARVADLDGDGHLDVVASANFESTYPEIETEEQRISYFGDGTGNFERHRAETAKEAVESLALGDFNEDGSTDLAVTAVGTDGQLHALVHRNDGAGAFLPASTLDAKEGYEFPIVNAGDLDGDGRIDVVLQEYERIALHRQLPDGSIDRFGDLYGVWSYNEMLQIVDLDGDGRMDVIVPSSYQPNISFHLQDQYGLQHARKIAFPIGGVPSQYEPTSMAIGDFNGDGVKDAAIATKKAGMVLLSGSLTPYLGAGALAGAPSVGSPVLDPTSTYPDFRVTVGVGPPANDGGEAVSGYSVFSVPSGAVDLDAGAPVSTHRIRQLEENRSYTFYARAHNAAGLGPPSPVSSSLVLGTPEDPEPLPNLRVEYIGEGEFDLGVFPRSFTIRLDRPAPPGGVHFDLATSNGSATAGSDYTALVKPGMSIPEGLMESEPVEVNFLGDLIEESDETININMLNVQGAAATAYQGTMTIYDDDTAATRMAVSWSSVTEGNAGSKTVFATVTLSRTFPTAVSFDLRSECYNCGAGDYDEFDLDDVVILPGMLNVQIPIVIHGDTVYEREENIQLWLDDLKPAGDSNVMYAYQWVGLVKILNDDAAPQLSVADANVTEGNQGESELTFNVTLSEPAPLNVYFSAETVNGSASAGSDYISRHIGGVYLAAGETSTEVKVRVIGDTRFEANETFSLQLKDAHGAVIGDGTGVGTLTNDDVAGGIAIDDSQIVEGNGGNKALVFNVRLSQPSVSPVTFDAFTSPGSAHPGSDYLVQSGNGLVIPAGNTLTTFSVPIVGDVDVENHESFVVELANVVGATVTKGQGRGRILNDDLPTLSIGDATALELDEGEHVTARFKLTLSAPSPVPVQFTASFVPGGSASPGYDHPYEVSPTPIYIDAGRTTGTIEVMVFGDGVVEPDETFQIQLSAVNGAILGDGLAVGTIINDDAPTARVTASKASQKVQKRVPRVPVRVTRRDR